VKKILKWCSIVILGLLIICIGAIQLVDLNKYKAQLNEVVQRYGFRLDIQGNIKFSLFPNLGIYIDSPTKLYTLSDSTKEVFEVEQMKCDIRLLPLLVKQLNLENLYLNNIQFNIDKKFLRVLEDIKKQNYEPEKALKQANQGVKENNFKYKLNIIEIKNGTVNYNVDDTRFKLSKLSLKSKTGKEAEINGDLKNLNKNIGAEFKVQINDLEKFVDGRKAEIDGWIGFDSIEFKLAGSVENQEKNFVVSDFNVKFDSNEIKGALNYNKVSNVTELQGMLDLRSLIFPNDFAIFFNDNSHSSSRKGQDHHEVYDAKAEIWDSSPINLSFLSNLYLDLKVQGREVQLYGVNIDKFKGNLNVKNGNLSFRIDEGSMAEGFLKAKMDIVSKNYKSNIELRNARLDLLCKNLFNTAHVYGLIDAESSFESMGNSMSSLVQNLQGRGSLHIKEGKIRETKFIPDSILNLSNLNFDKIEGSFTIKNGIIYNQNFVLSSPLLLLTGQGEINLPQYTINYLINPEKVYDNKIADKGFLVEVKGELGDPKVSLNAEKFVTKAIKDTAKKVFKVDKALEKVLDGIL
jgi:AsmA protein